jgi:hypothetical protein
MKFISFIIALFVASCTHTKVSGEFNYHKKEYETAKNKVGLNFKKPIYETKDGSKMFYTGGSIYHNYDIFNSVYHINGFGHFGVEF